MQSLTLSVNRYLKGAKYLWHWLRTVTGRRGMQSLTPSVNSGLNKRHMLFLPPSVDITEGEVHAICDNECWWLPERDIYAMHYLTPGSDGSSYLKEIQSSLDSSCRPVLNSSKSDHMLSYCSRSIFSSSTNTKSGSGISKCWQSELQWSHIQEIVITPLFTVLFILMFCG